MSETAGELQRRGILALQQGRIDDGIAAYLFTSGASSRTVLMTGTTWPISSAAGARSGTRLQSYQQALDHGVEQPRRRTPEPRRDPGGSSGPHCKTRWPILNGRSHINPAFRSGLAQSRQSPRGSGRSGGRTGGLSGRTAHRSGQWPRSWPELRRSTFSRAMQKARSAG